MTDEQLPETPPATKAPKSAGDGPPWFTLITLIIAVLLLACSVVSDRLTPYTDLARVRAYVVPVVPEVSGQIVEVTVQQDAVVRAGTPLFKIDKRNYQLAVESAEAALAQVTQDVSADEAGLNSVVAQLSEAEANLRNVEQQTSRVFTLTKKKLLPAADADTAQAQLDAARAKVSTAEAELNRTREKLGATGAQNARVEQALAQLKKARLDLNRTEITAPGFGVVTNLNIDEGYFARAGQPALTFISAGNIWVEAAMRENSLGNITEGSRVELILDVDPGHIHTGRVRTIGFGVKQGQDTSIGVLPQVRSNSGWLRDAQRFPVLIELDDQASLMQKLRVGGQADVTVYTGDHPLFNRLARLRMQFVSWLSYLY